MVFKKQVMKAIESIATASLKMICIAGFGDGLMFLSEGVLISIQEGMITQIHPRLLVS